MKVTGFGEYKGSKVHSITLENSNGIVVEIITFGAILKNVFLNDKFGKRIDIVTGYDNLQGYVNDTVSMGAVIGRVANRIGNAKFCLEGKEYTLAANNGVHHLHGGDCLSKRVWEHETFTEAGCEGIRLTTQSSDGECGYPCDVRFIATYTLNSQNQLVLRLQAQNQSTMKTIVNLTNHSYFNLEESDSIYGHELRLDSDSYLPIDDSGLVTGEIKELEGKLKELQKGVQLKEVAKNGIIDVDNDFILRPNGSLRLESPKTGISVSISTTNPIIHIYCAQFFENIKGKKGKLYEKCCAIAIEPQKHTNAINMSQFPSVVLDGLGAYSEDIVYTFNAGKQ